MIASYDRSVFQLSLSYILTSSIATKNPFKCIKPDYESQKYLFINSAFEGL